MYDSELQQQRHNSQFHNEDVLLDIGFSRLGRSKVFSNETGAYIVSPGISLNQDGEYWFDISYANLRQIGSSTQAWVLVRMVPNLFAFFTIDDIRGLMNENTQENNRSAYGFYCNLDQQTCRIESKEDPNYSFTTDLLDHTNVERSLANIEI